MSQLSSWRCWLSSALLLAACFVFSNTVFAQSMRPLKLSELANVSDDIFVGQCVKKETLVRNGRIVSRYTLRPSEMLKGKTDPALQGNIIIEEPGGELTTGKVPVGQLVTGQADFRQGEDVLLFARQQRPNPKIAELRAKRAAKLKSKGGEAKPTFDPKALRIVGMNQGYYTIITHPETGEKLVTAGEKSPMSRLKGSTLDHVSTATAARIKQVTSKRLSNELAKAQSSQKAGLALGKKTDHIQPFSSLNDVKSQIALALQKSK